MIASGIIWATILLQMNQFQSMSKALDIHAAKAYTSVCLQKMIVKDFQS